MYSLHMHAGARLFLRSYSHLLVGTKPPRGSKFDNKHLEETVRELLETDESKAIAPRNLVDWLTFVLSEEFKEHRTSQYTTPIH